jgi:uncharacterized membrane protein YhhN
VGSTAAFLALAIADTVLAATGRSSARRITKPLLMPVLMLGRDRPTQRALALGGVGDVALLGRGQVAFTAGLGSFLGGHAAWIAALRARGGCALVRRRPVLAVPELAACGLLNAVLWRHTGRDRWPVLAYSAALTAMAVVALDSGEPAAAAGGAAFMASDCLLALERFGVVRLPWHEGWVMATYTAAQALLADGGARAAGV